MIHVKSSQKEVSTSDQSNLGFLLPSNHLTGVKSSILKNSSVGPSDHTKDKYVNCETWVEPWKTMGMKVVTIMMGQRIGSPFGIPIYFDGTLILFSNCYFLIWNNCISKRHNNMSWVVSVKPEDFWVDTDVADVSSDCCCWCNDLMTISSQSDFEGKATGYPLVEFSKQNALVECWCWSGNSGQSLVHVPKLCKT